MFTAQRLDGETVEIADDNGIENVMDELTTARTDDEFVGAKYEADRLATYAADPEVTRIAVEPIEEIDFAVTRTDGTTEFVEAKAANGPLHQGKLERYVSETQEKFTAAKDSPELDLDETDSRILTVGAKNDGLKVDEFGRTRQSIKTSLEQSIKAARREGDISGRLNFGRVRIITQNRVYEFDVDELDTGL